MRAKISVTAGDTLGALQGFLQQLLQAGVVQALLVPMRTPGGGVTPALVTDPGLLAQADPFAPVLPVNGATLAGQLSIREPQGKVGAVLRSCELRALVELVKLQQASLDNLILIAIDCAGTFSVPVFRQKEANGQEKKDWLDLYRVAEQEPGANDPQVRPACQICEQPVFSEAQISIELFGSHLEHEIGVSLPDELGARFGLETAETNGQPRVIENLVVARLAAREAEFAAIHARLEGVEGLAGVFDACLRCHNCMNVCPICYCKTCVFKSPIFDHEPIHYMQQAASKGACRLPADTLLFHLTRLNHMALSCVGCGLCTAACPADLPVGLVFRAIGQRLQTVFDYAPGRSVDDPLPLVTFKADEWTDVGE